MGIDIYAEWNGMTEAERNARVTGFSIEHGHVGYLREAYHGSPYVTKYLVPEAFASEDGVAAIPAAVMLERLPAAVLLSMYREHKVYGGGDPAVVDLSRDGVGALIRAIAKAVPEAAIDQSHLFFARKLSQKTLATAQRLIDAGALAPVQKSFVDFVELCARKEAETGKPCRIIASY
jgi:hypothetical protein